MIDRSTPRATVAGYLLEEKLGSGSTGVVWRARRDGPLCQVVAVKRLRPGVAEGEVDRLKAEADVLARLDHPHIVRVFEVVDDDDGLALVMQYGAGGSLAEVLAARGRLPPDEVVALAAPVADALASAHRRDVLHCDVKPANILFTSDGEPLLSDFGVARRFAPSLTAEQVVAGTAEYLAPELLDGGHPDARSDVYSLGVICYEALAGRAPYTGDCPLAAVRAADLARHPPLAEVAGVPPALARVVERAMARHPAERYRGAPELATALRHALGQTAPGPPSNPGHSPPPTGAGGRETATFGPRPPRPVLPPSARRRSRRILVLGGMAAGLVMAAVAVGSIRGALVGAGPDTSRLAPGCPDPPSPPVPAGATVLQGDLDGDGCPSLVVRQGDVVEAVVDAGEAQPRRFQIGQPGDVMVLGDWDCDGTDTPGLYRPATGTVYYFFAWARSGAALPQAEPLNTSQRGATPEVSDDGANGCQEIVLVGGETTPPGATAPPGTATDEA